MAKKIKFTFNDKNYTLEYSRRTVKELEAQGFNYDLVDVKPMTMIPLLFAGAFKMHHSREKAETIDTIYKMFGDKDKLYSALGDMYRETLETLMDEPEESKKVEWTVE